MISDKLKEIRENAGMNKKEFANYIGVKYTTYNGYETGAREPDSDFLILISTKFDVSTDYILGLQTESNVLHSYSLKASEYSHIEKYRNLDDYGRETVDLILERETKRTSTIAGQASRIAELEQSNITQLPDRSYLEPVAAHKRTDIEQTANGDQHDDDIMDDDSEWE